ncbi:MAG: hypothetical protein JWM32_2196 [Verrucomicrobia bacterium]|nr:hypothetical protein [Verrucomicrobiota bacterium]
MTPPEPPESKANAVADSGRTTEFVLAAEPILPLAAPVYPAAALAMRPGRVVVGVRVRVDTEGRATVAGPSLAVFSSYNARGLGFREAVDDAVGQWKFVPARMQRTEGAKGADGGDLLMIKAAGTTEWVFDVAFTFTAAGDVLSDVPGMSAAPPAQRLRNFFVRLFHRRVLSRETP